MVCKVFVKCDDGFETEVLFGANSSVGDLIKHVVHLKLRSSSDSSRLDLERIVGYVFMEDSQKTKSQPRGKKQVPAEVLDATTGKKLYVLSSTPISSLLSTPNQASLIFYLEGFESPKTEFTFGTN
jgi:hypothetical protein